MYDALDKDAARTGQVDMLLETQSLLELDRLCEALDKVL